MRPAGLRSYGGALKAKSLWRARAASATARGSATHTQASAASSLEEGSAAALLARAARAPPLLAPPTVPARPLLTAEVDTPLAQLRIVPGSQLSDVILQGARCQHSLVPLGIQWQAEQDVFLRSKGEERHRLGGGGGGSPRTCRRQLGPCKAELRLRQAPSRRAAGPREARLERALALMVAAMTQGIWVQ